MCVAIFYPLRSLTAQETGGLIATYDFHNYRLGRYVVDGVTAETLDSGMTKMKNHVSADSSTELVIVGRADATPWNSCKGDQDCSALKNQTLAELRASSFASILSKKYGIDPSRIYSRGEVASVRGGEFRGVTVYIRRLGGHVSQTATVTPNSSSEVASLRSDVAGLKDSVAVLSHRNTVPSPAPAQPTSPVETPTNIAPPETTVVHIEPPVRVDVGVGIAGVKINHVDAFAPTIGIYIKPRASPVDFFLEGGYRPSRSSNKCNRADVIGTLGARVGLRNSIGLSGGLFTAREMCTNGGPKLNERWLDRTNGVFVGPSITFRLADLQWSFDPALTWGSTYNAQKNSSTSGFGLQLRFHIQTGGNRKP